MYSDQPTMPSSVVTFRNELTRHPASQCRSSIAVIFIRRPLANLTAVPAKAGTHLSAAGTADGWTPAFAGDARLLAAAEKEVSRARCRLAAPHPAHTPL